MTRITSGGATSLAVVMAIASFCPLGWSQPIDVFVLAGQSNAIHRQARGAAPFELRSQPTALHSHYIRNGAGQLNQSPTPAPYSLDPGEGFGPEIGLIDELVSAYQSEVFAVVQVGWGGTSLAGPWAAGEPFFEDEFIPFIQQSLTALQGQGYTPTVRGVSWIQGENDAGIEDEAEAYAANLEDFRLRVQSSLDADFYLGVSTLHTDSIREFADVVLAAQEAVAAASPGVGLIRPDDLPMNSDLLHYPAASAIEMGRRLARSYLSFLGPSGDLHADGVVSLDDYNAWADGFGGLAALRSDANLDGYVDAADFTLWRDALTAPAPAALPEPASVCLCALGVLAVARRPVRC